MPFLEVFLKTLEVEMSIECNFAFISDIFLKITLFVGSITSEWLPRQ